MTFHIFHDRRDITESESETPPRREMVKEQLGRVGEPLSTSTMAKRDYESEKRREVEELKRFREEMVRSVDQQREDARREFENEASM